MKYKPIPVNAVFTISQMADGKWKLHGDGHGVSGPYDDRYSAEEAMKRVIADVCYHYDEAGNPL